MEMQAVRSSNISSIGYDLDTQELFVRFHSGQTYVYYDVPVRVYNNLMGASSHGSYFAAAIRNAYRFKKVS